MGLLYHIKLLHFYFLRALNAFSTFFCNALIGQTLLGPTQYNSGQDIVKGIVKKRHQKVVKADNKKVATSVHSEGLS